MRGQRLAVPDDCFFLEKGEDICDGVRHLIPLFLYALENSRLAELSHVVARPLTEEDEAGFQDKVLIRPEAQILQAVEEDGKALFHLFGFP